MASKPDERRCFIDYLPSLLLLWGLLFFQQDVAAQQPDLFVEITSDPTVDCSVIDPDEFTVFTIKVGNKGGDLSQFWIPLVGTFKPEIVLVVNLNGSEIINERRPEGLSNGASFSRTFEIKGPIAAEISANVLAYYDHSHLRHQSESNRTIGDNYREITFLSKPVPGLVQGEENICRYTSPHLQVTGEVLVARSEVDFYRWEIWDKDSDSWQELAETSAPSYQPESQTGKATYRSTTIARFNGLACESEPGAPIVVKTKICQVASNPMMRMQALKPATDSEE